MCIAGEQAPAFQALQIGMCHDTFHQPFAKGISAIIFMDEDIAQIGKHGAVGHNAGKADLLVAIIDSKVNREPNGLLDHLTRTFICPISKREKVTDRVDI